MLNLRDFFANIIYHVNNIEHCKLTIFQAFHKVAAWVLKMHFTFDNI